jgi:hypothetical protein
VQYVPLPHGLKFKEGALTGRLKLSFVSEKGEPRAVTLSGAARVDRLAIVRSDDSPLMAARSIVASLSKLDPLVRALVLEGLTIEAPDFDLKRGSDGVLRAPAALRAGAGGRNRGRHAAPGAAAPWTYGITELHVTDGKIRVADEAVATAFRVALCESQHRRPQARVERRCGLARGGIRFGSRAPILAQQPTSTSRKAPRAATSR